LLPILLPNWLARGGTRNDGTPERGRWRVEAFDRGLRERGWTPGRDVQLEYRWPNGDPAAATALARELVEQKLHLLVATNTMATNALRAVAGSTPILFVNVTEPVAAGLVQSLSRPGGNVTGFTDMEPAIAGKWLELLLELSPTVQSVGMVYSPEVAPYAHLYLNAFKDAATSLRVEGRVVHVRSLEDYEPVMQACGSESACALIVLDDGLFTRQPAFVTNLALKHRVPAMYTNVAYVKRDGGLLAYGVDLEAMYVQSAVYMDRILKGERPEDLPVQMPIKFRLGVNLKTAAALGLSMPPRSSPAPTR
jgi:putative tryptophan/tyrosine transport system substrate-binding protein